jgi:branched-subunit amino acid aminotransferase/4-amino-4-deoxychorismate lyase
MEIDGMTADLDRVSVLALTNYGHFTSMRVESGRVRGLALHLQRLSDDCRTLFDAELDTDRVRTLVRHALGERISATVVRVTVFDPDLDLGTPGCDARPRILVTVRPTSEGAPAPLRLRAVHHARELPEVKHVGLFPTLHHRRTAQRSGFDDVLLVGADGRVSEIATSNIGVIVGDRVIWPDAPCLAGVTMRLLHRATGEHRRERLTLADVTRADAVFATNAAVGVRPVAAVDERRWTQLRNPVLRRLRERYNEITPESL